MHSSRTQHYGRSHRPKPGSAFRLSDLQVPHTQCHRIQGVDHQRCNPQCRGRRRSLFAAGGIPDEQGPSHDHSARQRWNLGRQRGAACPIPAPKLIENSEYCIDFGYWISGMKNQRTFQCGTFESHKSTSERYKITRTI